MGLLAFLTHIYLGSRVWRVCNRNIFLGIVLVVLSLSALGMAIAASIISFRFEFWFDRISMKPLALAGTINVVIVDGLIATILCIYLLKQRTVRKDLRKVINRIVIFAINTGLVTSVLATLNVVTFLVFPNTMIFLGTNFIFTKIYANCLLANLNARTALRGQGFLGDGTLSLNLSALRTRQGAAITYHEFNPNSDNDKEEPPSPYDLHLANLADNSRDKLFPR